MLVNAVTLTLTALNALSLAELRSRESSTQRARRAESAAQQELGQLRRQAPLQAAPQLAASTGVLMGCCKGAGMRTNGGHEASQQVSDTRGGWGRAGPGAGFFVGYRGAGFSTGPNSLHNRKGHPLFSRRCNLHMCAFRITGARAGMAYKFLFQSLFLVPSTKGPATDVL